MTRHIVPPFGSPQSLGKDGHRVTTPSVTKEKVREPYLHAAGVRGGTTEPRRPSGKGHGGRVSSTVRGRWQTRDSRQRERREQGTARAVPKPQAGG